MKAQVSTAFSSEKFLSKVHFIGFDGVCKDFEDI